MIVQMTVGEFEDAVQRAVALALSGKDVASAPALKSKGRKPRDPDAPKKEPNEFALFMKRINALMKDNDVKSKASENMQFASYLKNQKPMADWEDEEILAERESWTKPEVSKQEAEGKSKRKPSVDASAAPAAAPAASAEPAKPKRVISDEQKAKMKAGREAAKAKKDAEKAASAAVPAPVAAPAPPAPAPAPAPAPVAEVVTEQWVRKAFQGKKYLFNPANNHVRQMEEDGSMGAWVGILKDPKKGIIDRSVPEPEDDGEDFELDEE